MPRIVHYDKIIFNIAMNKDEYKLYEAYIADIDDEDDDDNASAE